MALNVKINETEYRLPLFASDITLEKFIDLVKLEQAEMPEELKQVIEEPDIEQRRWKAGRMPKRIYARKIVPYYAKAISTVTGVPEKVLLGDKKHDGAPVRLIETWYWNMVNSLARFKPDTGKDSFLIDGERWVLPKENMKSSTFGEFAEAAQYEEYQADAAAGNWDKMPFVMAILLKPEGEQYDPYTFGNDDFIEGRAEIMKRQTMDLVYQVSFFLLRRSENSKTDSLIYTISRLLATYKPEANA